MSINPIIGALLLKRGITPEKQEAFVHPQFERDQDDAATMKGMQLAVERLARACEMKESVLVFGDYDADGVPAAALLTRVLSRLGVAITPLIPTRTEGYGLTMATVEVLLQNPAKLILTVDNGTVAKAEVAALTAAGKEVIVIDHHEPQEGEVVDTAFALINPKQKGCPYPFKELCACALSWKLLQQLYKRLGKPEQQLKWELDLVALSTIADMVPLVGENRLFALYGLQVLRKTRNLGLKMIMETAGLVPDGVTAGDLGFKIAPRINAPSRMHQEEVAGENAAVTLLITDEHKLAATLAKHLDTQNAERQVLVERHIAEADIQAMTMTDSLVLVVYHEEWSSGVIGLVASRLLEKYKRPVIALAHEGESVKGSVRSVDGVHAVQMLSAASTELLRFGGHAKAAGLTLTGDISIFRGAVNQFAEAQGATLAQLAKAAERSVDLDLELSDVTLELCEALAELEPFGIGFPRPVFRADCSIESPRLVGKAEQHLSCFLGQGEIRKKAIGFRLGEHVVEPGQLYTVYFTVEAETWRDITSPSCYIQRIESLGDKFTNLKKTS